MSAPVRRRTPQQIDAEVRREVARITEEYGTRPELLGKCRVCRNPETKRRVNTMLSYGMRPQEVVDNIADINATLRKDRQISYWSVYLHRKNHFNVQEQVKESTLRILERRAEEEGLSLAEGVGSILTLRGYLEIIASKGFKKLLEADEVGFITGLDAQRELEALMKADRDEAERAALRRDVALIQQAIVETLSPEQMRAVSHRLDVLRGVVSEDDEDQILDAEVDEDFDAIGEDSTDVADFVMDVDDEDELE